MYRSNILLDNKLTAELSDFGFSIQLPQSTGSKTLIISTDGFPGTDGYRPPEYSDRRFSVPSDLYSYGVVRKGVYFRTRCGPKIIGCTGVLLGTHCFQ